MCVRERERASLFFLNIRFPFFHDYDEVGQDRTGKETRSFVMTKPFFYNTLSSSLSLSLSPVSMKRDGDFQQSNFLLLPFIIITSSSLPLFLSSTVSFQPNKAAGTIISNQSISPSNPCILLSLLSRVRIPILPS